MGDVPDGMVTDATRWRWQALNDGWTMVPTEYDGDWVDVVDHNREVLLLRKQIWQLLQQLDNAREAADRYQKLWYRFANEVHPWGEDD